MRPKVCVVCGDALAIGTRADHRYCGVNCRVRAHHVRRGFGTRQARNDRRVRVLEETIERLKQERDTALAEVERVRSAATATPHPPRVANTPRRPVVQGPTPSVDRLRNELREAHASNRVKDQRIEGLQRELEQQAEELNAEKDSQKARTSSLEEALKRAAEETKRATQQATQRAKHEAEAAFESERRQNALARKLAEDRAQSAEDALKRDHSVRDTIGNALATFLGSKALDLEKQRIAVAMNQPKADTARADDPRPTANARANPEKPPVAAPPPLIARTERAPPADDLAAWEVLRRKALSQRWLPIADTTHGAIRAELRAESEVAQKYTARGLATTARILASGEEGERQTQIAALQAKWSFIERPPPSWKKPIRWDRGRYQLDIFSELEVAKLAAERRREWERKLRE